MQSFKLPVLAVLLLASSAYMNSSVAAQTDVAGNDHQALARNYESLAKETRARLQENIEILKEYEAHPYYFGRQGQDVRSHASANIREYEKTLKENLDNADLHRRMAMEQNRNFTAARSGHSSNKGL